MEGDASGPFCCTGCAVVYELLREEGLSEKYYDLLGKGARVAAVDAAPERLERVDHKWIEPIANELRESVGSRRLLLGVQGTHCAACVWLIDELFARQEGAQSITTSPVTGSIELWATSAFNLERFVRAVERFGYRLGPKDLATEEARPRSSDLIWRMGTAVALAMNAMLLSIAMYAGLSSGPIFDLFQRLNVGISTLAVLVGGTVFFRSAFQALRARIIHADLPVALGILLAYGASLVAYARGDRSHVYFDTLNVFIALMLVGRFIQERVLLRNRARVLASHGAEWIRVRRLRNEATELIACTKIEMGDRIVLGHMDLAPVAVRLVDNEAEFSLDWIDGESRPRRFERSAIVPAGAFHTGPTPCLVEATEGFATSRLVPLLRSEHERADESPRSSPFWRLFSRVYIVSVLAIAALTLVAWSTFDPARAHSVVAAVLMVTCPCAFGIAAPLAYELAQAGLRRTGLFVRTAGLLDRLPSVKKVVFDKTGTLTNTEPTLRTDDFGVLDRAELETLYNLAARSSHPRSRAVEFSLKQGTWSADVRVEEVVGKGVQCQRFGRTYRLGSAAWTGATDGDLVFSCDGVPLRTFVMDEKLLADAPNETARLRERGLELFVLSGDRSPRVDEIAARCGIAIDHAFGEVSPEGKKAFIRAHDKNDLLFIGDGINDSLAAEGAFASGTPSIERPFLAAKTDFFFVHPGLRPIRKAFEVGDYLRKVVRRALGIALLYNGVMVPLAAFGLMTPLACAVLMPISSLSTVLYVTFALSERRSIWRS